MSEAAYALAGTTLGILSTIVADLLRGRREDRRRHHEALRSVCTDFIAGIARTRRLCLLVVRDGVRIEQYRDQIEDQFADARAGYEQLCIMSEREETQRAARHVLHYASILVRITRGRPYEWSSAERSMFGWQQAFHVEVRRELRVRHPAAVFREPAGGMPAAVPRDEQNPGPPG